MKKTLLLLLGSGLLAFGQQPIRIACGSVVDVTSTDGKTWVADNYFTGGNRHYAGYPISGTPNPTLYSWARTGYYGDFSYTIPAANGNYQLTLKFAEAEYFTAGGRVFNVVVNGTPVLTNFDIIRDYGPLVAVDRQFPVQVTNGTVKIEVNGVTKVGTLSAIALEATDGTTTPPPTSTASAFVRLDTNTQGSWKNVYGGEGYQIVGDTPALPGFAQLSAVGASTFVWATPNDPRALQLANGSRIASTWYSATSFSLDLNLTDGNTHQVAMYALDYDSSGRRQLVEVLDASGTPLDSRTMSSFVNGQYLVWNLSGHVVIRVTRLAGTNAVASAIFVGTAPNSNAPPSLGVSTSALTFSASLGSGTSSPQSVNISNTGGGSLDWTAAKTAPWLNLSATAGTAPSTLSLTVNPGSMAAGSYTDTVTIAGPGGPKTVAVTMNIAATASISFVNRDSTRQGSWKNTYGGDGYYLIGDPPALPSYAQLSVTGAQTFIWTDPSSEPRALQHASGNSRVAGVWYGNLFNFDLNFTDGASHQLALYATDYDSSGRSERIDILDSTSGAVLDTQTLTGFVQGQYLIWNLSGHVVIRVTKLGGPNAVVGGLFFGAAGTPPPTQPVLTLSASTLNFAALVGGGNPASQKVTITNTGTGSLVWTASENASWLTLTSASGTAPSDLTINASPAGLAAGTYTENVIITSAGATGSPKSVAVTLVVSPVSTSTGGAANFVTANFFGQGNWIGSYGADGYAFVGTTSLPSYVQMSVTGASQYTWFASTNIPSGLQNVNGNGRFASCWYSATSFTYDLNFVDSGVHRFTLYAMDFDGLNRGEKIEILDGASGAVLDTQQVASFSGGRYLSWNASGHIQVRVTNVGSQNAVVSGLFFDPIGVPGLNLSLTSLSFSGVTGTPSPAAKSVSISNPAGTPINWTAAYSAPWMSLSATSGATPATVNVNVSLAGLAAGTYTNQITITSPDVPGATKTIDVTFNVTDAPVISLLPVAQWTFDTNTISGTTIADVSGNQLNGTRQGPVGAVSFEDGPSGTQVAVFNGSSGYITTRTDPREAIKDDLTLAAWIRTTNSSRTETIIAKYDLSGNEDGYMFETTAAGYLAMHLGGTNILGSTRDFVDGTNKINDGQWHHVVAIIRASQDLQFYVDGGLSSIFYLTIKGGSIAPALTIGGPVLFGQNFFTGAMDDVRIYPRAITTSEISQLWGKPVLISAGGELLYNGINLPKIFPPSTTPTQEYRTPYYINNPPRVIPIDLGRQLFVDDFLIDKTTMVRTPHQAQQRSQPVLTPGSPISAGAWWSPAAQRYQLWYYDPTAPVPDSYRYSYSTDGLNWIKPTFPDVYGPGTNAVVRNGDTIWLDLEEPDPAKRYKSFGIAPGAGNDLGKIYIYFSPDGIHWGPRIDNNIYTISDRTTVYYNAFRKVWINSDRGAVGLPATDKVAGATSRARYYSESKDLLNWFPSNPNNTYWTGVDENDTPYAGPGGEPPELYNLDGVAYESVMVGLFSWFHPGIGYKDYTRPGPILVEVGVGFSRDGFSWIRPNRGTGPNGAFIPASNIAGTWNAYNTQSTGGGFVIVGDEMWFYFSARSLQKPLDGVFSTGVATLRRDGFFSMDAGSSEGTLTTRPVKFSGNHMFVNVKDPSGVLKIEALDENDAVIPGFEASNFVPVTVDKASQEVSWTGANVGSLAGRNVKFKFYLTNGSLYSFWVTASQVGASNGYVAAGGPNFTTLTDTTGK